MLPIDVALAADDVVAIASRQDTSYGRVDADSAIALSAGAAIDVHGVRGSVDLRYRYLHTAGFFLTYEDGFGAGAEPVRVGLAGLELRPLFLGRYLQGYELGAPRLDLLIDSIALELGGFVGQPASRGFGDAAGLVFGVAAEFPFLPKTNGPFLAVRAQLRWSREALSAADATSVDVEAFVVTVALGWQINFGAHVVDVGDEPK
ncbi:MAG TPA: hypothetical protein VGH28_06965 [Polyangiaceae bacterium]|jgi:hypothetical protein